MAYRMDVQEQPHGSYVEIDLEGTGAADFHLMCSLSHPARFTWSMCAAQHSLPLKPGDFVRFWDDDENDDSGTPFSETNPIFEGHIASVNPGKNTSKVVLEAFDPTQKAASDVSVMSMAWDDGNIGATGSGSGNAQFPTPSLGSVPRLVMNVSIDNDDDIAFSRAQWQTVGEMMALILSDEYPPLYWMNAAPGAGDAGGDTAYELADLAGMSFIPQEKIVIDSDTIAGAIDRLLQWAPRFRVVWVPGERKWRFFDVNEADSVTLTLNDQNDDHPVLSFELQRSIEGRYSAVKIYGPETTVITTATTAPDASGTHDAGLEIHDSQDYSVLEVLGSKEIRSYRAYQISDPAKRKMARILPDWVNVPVGNYWTPTRMPTLQASWDDGNTWTVIHGAHFDFSNGIAYTGTNTSIFSEEGKIVDTGRQHFFPPTDFRVVYAYFTDPMSVRSPASGFQGTFFDLTDEETEFSIYDESLAVGYEFGTPISTTARLSQFQTLCSEIHKQRRDIIYTGAFTLDGLDWRFLRLQKTLNIAGVDGDGNSIPTGWENIKAVVTDVEYDFEELMTIVTLSSDQLELVGADVETLKSALRIRAMTRRDTFGWSYESNKVRRFTEWGTPFIHVEHHAKANHETFFVDSLTGDVDASQIVRKG